MQSANSMCNRSCVANYVNADIGAAAPARARHHTLSVTRNLCRDNRLFYALNICIQLVLMFIIFLSTKILVVVVFADRTFEAHRAAAIYWY